MRARIERLLREKKVLICVGGGGVGKTTISASLALAAACGGRRVALLTIDPARRLKDALGLPGLGSEPARVALHGLGVPPGGELTAMVLDAQRTFDQLVARFAPTLEAAERILHNRLYQYVSGRLAGAQEYMALEKLYEIAVADVYDLLIVDTPPTHHALDFLDAPRRIVDLLTSRAIALLGRPSLALIGAGSRLAQAAVETILRALERFTGLTLLSEVADFVAGFEGMTEGFRSRAEAVRRLLRDPATAALLVTSADPMRVAETLAFRRELEAAGLRVGAMVMNRTVPESLLRGTPGRNSALPPEVRRKLDEARLELEALAERDRRMAERLTAAGEALPVARVPNFPRDVASLNALREIAEVLVPGIGRRGKIAPLRQGRS
jgi:anion-transporting  ArsA/GET3 family ATPase